MTGQVLVIDGTEWRIIGPASWSDTYWVIESPTGLRSVRSDAVLRRHFELCGCAR